MGYKLSTIRYETRSRRNKQFHYMGHKMGFKDKRKSIKNNAENIQEACNSVYEYMNWLKEQRNLYGI